MTTSLASARKGLSKELGDYWDSTSTSGGSSATVVDTALKAKANDWISDSPQEHYDLITSGTYADEERKISSLDNTSGTLTTLAHGGTIATSVTYEIHRLFSASDKRIALISAAKSAFPFIHKRIRDTSLTVGNWLRDGDFEYGWTTSALNTYWVASTSTQAKNTTAPYYTRGATSLKLDTAAGYTYQSNTQNPLLDELKGQAVTFKAKVWSDTATDTRLQIYDGTTTTYSTYHAGDSKLAELTVSATITSSPSSIRFALVRAGAVSTAYIDDARVTGPKIDRLYIRDLGLAMDYPHIVEEQTDSNYLTEPWYPIRDYEIGSDGYLYLREGSSDYRLRVSGIGYLDFLASGVSSTAWSATMDIDDPQTKILYGEAIMYLYTQMITPNFTAGDRDKFAQMLQYWEKELANRKARFGMKIPPVKVNWSVN